MSSVRSPVRCREVFIHHRQELRREPLADQAALREPADRGKAVADDRRAVAVHVGGDGDDAGCQAAGRNGWIGVAGDRDAALGDVENTHGLPQAG
jgi:hypothetical protein